MAGASQLVSQEGYKQVTFVCRMCETESTCTYIFTEPIVCVDCGKRIKNLEQSANGIIVNNKKHYVCKICIKFFSSVCTLRNHLNSIHGPSQRSYKCTKCEKCFIHKRNLEKHIENHKKIWYHCPKCPRRFPKAKLLENHKKFHLKLRAHICNTCGQTFASAPSLKQHGFLHLDYQNHKFQCKICFKYFSSKQCVKKHLKYVHSNNKLYECTCGKTYKYKHSLKFHIDTYKGEYPHLECVKQILSQSSLHVPGRVYSSVRSYECDTCKKTFKTKTYIRNHVLIHLPREKRQCHICGKWFLNKHTLRYHRRVHSSMRLYECDTCKKTFKSKNGIKQHVEIHFSRKRVYKCLLCGKGFLTKRTLSWHEKTHLSLRPYECDTCKKTFKRKENLKRHVVLHLSLERRYQCRECGKRFLRESDFNTQKNYSFIGASV